MWKEQATTKWKNLGKFKRREEMPVNMVHQPSRILLTGILSRWSDVHATKKYPESEWLATDNLETNPIAIKPKTEPCGAQVSWAPFPCSSSPRHPFPIQTLALSACGVSSDNSLPSTKQELTLRPWKGPASYNKMIKLASCLSDH